MTGKNVTTVHSCGGFFLKGAEITTSVLRCKGNGIDIIVSL